MKIKVNKEIRNYREDAVAGLSWRQVFWGGLGIVIVAILNITMFDGNMTDVKNTIARCLVSIFVVGPFWVIGFFEYHGMKIETFVKIAWRNVSWSHLTYIPYNLYKLLHDEQNQTGGDKNKKRKTDAAGVTPCDAYEESIEERCTRRIKSIKESHDVTRKEEEDE